MGVSGRKLIASYAGWTASQEARSRDTSWVSVPIIWYVALNNGLRSILAHAWHMVGTLHSPVDSDVQLGSCLHALECYGDQVDEADGPPGRVGGRDTEPLLPKAWGSGARGAPCWSVMGPQREDKGSFWKPKPHRRQAVCGFNNSGL